MVDGERELTREEELEGHLSDAVDLIEMMDAVMWLKEKREISRQMESLIERCFKRCQGMERYSTEESDEYWELGQKLMTLWSQRSGKKIVRKESRV